MSHSTHWFTLWVLHPSSSEFIHYYSQPHSKQITAFLALIPMSDKSPSTGTPTSVTSATDICVSKAPCTITVIYFLVGSPINLTGGRFTAGTGLYVSSSSSYQQASVSQWHAHSRAVVFHTLHRGQRDTILCPLIS